MPIFVIVYFRLVAISSLCFVILSAAKDLEVCATIHRLRDLEILHYVQNDVVSVFMCMRHCEEGFARRGNLLEADKRLR